jgi:hypothetical protein
MTKTASIGKKETANQILRRRVSETLGELESLKGEFMKAQSFNEQLHKIFRVSISSIINNMEDSIPLFVEELPKGATKLMPAKQKGFFIYSIDDKLYKHEPRKPENKAEENTSGTDSKSDGKESVSKV